MKYQILRICRDFVEINDVTYLKLNELKGSKMLLLGLDAKGNKKKYPKRTSRDF